MTETLIPTEAFVTGKRKTAIARVRMRLGTGQILVNGRPANEYFPREALVGLVNQPIEVAGVGGRYDVIASGLLATATSAGASAAPAAGTRRPLSQGARANREQAGEYRQNRKCVSVVPHDILLGPGGHVP